ncbi:uncharacterized protein UBRO_20393 [Ustilago bromivora]|uniref:Uncharacterized protein n=1 Tax=Ustilago bromivora TaxID=307758 RepID=A0A1K0G2C8_9BASI|nr:uncharacterized protein UBRO_20393 [Ustilago bromivora]
MEGCGVAPSSYSGRSFRRDAATRTAANGADADTTRALGRWCSDCFRCYVDRSAAERAAISRTALYSNTSADLRLEIPARHSSLACSLTRLPLWDRKVRDRRGHKLPVDLSEIGQVEKKRSHCEKGLPMHREPNGLMG